MQIRTSNTEEDIRLRKSRSTLVTVGNGIMLFGVWSVIKALSIMFLRGNEGLKQLKDSMDSTDPDITGKEVLITALLGIFLYMLIELGVRVYIRRSAMIEGRGAGIRRLYIFLTVMICIYTLIFAVGELYITIKGSPDEAVSRIDSATAFFIDLTSLIMMIQMIIAHSRVKKYFKAHMAEVGHAA